MLCIFFTCRESGNDSRTNEIKDNIPEEKLETTTLNNLNSGGKNYSLRIVHKNTPFLPNFAACSLKAMNLG